MPERERRCFAMQRISFVNELYGEDYELKVAQRRFARFVNTTMMVTGLGAAVSDQLEDGRVVSGVGGQYNFVAMAQALPNARSILCVRSTRTSHGQTSSNVIWSYGHATIPRHLRDIVVTEYGIADLRGRTDRDIVETLVQVMDSRFQDTFIASAKRSGKLPHSYRVPEHARANTPQRLETLLKPHRTSGRFEEFPFGTEFTAEERVVAKALKYLQVAMAKPHRRNITILKALFARSDQTHQPYLQRLGLVKTNSLGEYVQRKLVVAALNHTAAKAQ